MTGAVLLDHVFDVVWPQRLLELATRDLRNFVALCAEYTIQNHQSHASNCSNSIAPRFAQVLQCSQFDNTIVAHVIVCRYALLLRCHTPKRYPHPHANDIRALLDGITEMIGKITSLIESHWIRHLWLY